VLNEPDQLFFADRVEEGRYVRITSLKSLGFQEFGPEIPRLVSNAAAQGLESTDRVEPQETSARVEPNFF
jgi:hypothetical protein